MFIVDAHFSVISENVVRSGEFGDDLELARSEHQFSLERVAEDMAINGVNVRVLMPYVYANQTILDHAQLDNNRVADIVKRMPDRFVGFCTSNPFIGPDRGASEVRRAIRELGLRGVVLNGRTIGYLQIDLLEQLDLIFEAASELRVPIMVDASQLGVTPDRVGFFAGQYPDITFMITQMGGTEGWRYALEQAKANENIILETSGFFRPSTLARRIVPEVGAARVVFGTGNLPTELELQRIRMSGLNDKDVEMILGHNMARILKLPIE